MPRTTEEAERPSEWLRRLDEDGGRYYELVADAGCLALAAYRLAQARCRVQSMPAFVPTARELMIAAAHIVQRIRGAASPIGSLILAECELAGLAVIRPISAEAA